MTGKRFEYIAFDGFTDNGLYITPHKVVELLNNLSDENEQLKQQIKELNLKMTRDLNNFLRK